MKNSNDEIIIDHEKPILCTSLRWVLGGCVLSTKKDPMDVMKEKWKAVTWQTNEIQASIIEY